MSQTPDLENLNPDEENIPDTQDNQDSQTTDDTPPTLDNSLQFEGDFDRNISEEMESCYLDYAMSVIVSRALPDVRDGLKPVHRRILFSMSEQGLRYSAKFRKSASVVGDVLAKYHPHGDSSVYDAMVRLAQDFSLRYPLVLGQGNFGSMDGDGAAAYRYTEAKMTKLSEYMLIDIDKETVLFRDNFKNQLCCQIVSLIFWWMESWELRSEWQRIFLHTTWENSARR